MFPRLKRQRQRFPFRVQQACDLPRKAFHALRAGVPRVDVPAKPIQIERRISPLLRQLVDRAGKIGGNEGNAAAENAVAGRRSTGRPGASRPAAAQIRAKGDPPAHPPPRDCKRNLPPGAAKPRKGFARAPDLPPPRPAPGIFCRPRRPHTPRSPRRSLRGIESPGGMRVYADDRHRRFRAAQRLSRVADDRVADRAAQPQHLAGDQQRALLSLLQQQCPGV